MGALATDGVVVHVHATTHEGIDGDLLLPYPTPPRRDRAAGFVDPTRIEIPGHMVVRSADEVVASVFSLSSAAPHLFGDRAHDFDAALRELLASVSPDGRFSEQIRNTAVDVWRA